MTGTLSPYIEVILEISLRIIHRIVAEKLDRKAAPSPGRRRSMLLRRKGEGY
jgi:hypothetical protein